MTLEPKFFNEIGDTPAEVFLKWWMPMVAARLSSYLGMGLACVNVILDVHQKHKTRFPPLVAPELWKTESPRSRDPIYRFAVATCNLPTAEAPVGIEEGQDSIYVDLDYVDRIAVKLGVSREAMLAPVAAHELSHLIRGHHSVPRSNRRYLQEGDAQRDANATLRTFEPAGSSTSDFFFAGALGGFVEEAIRAQQELAARQPDAYRNFPHRQVARRPMTASELWVDAPTLARVHAGVTSGRCPFLAYPEQVIQNTLRVSIGETVKLTADGMGEDGVGEVETVVVTVNEPGLQLRAPSSMPENGKLKERVDRDIKKACEATGARDEVPSDDVE